MWSGAWPSLEIIHLRDSLEATVQLVNRTPRDQPDEVTRALARFLVIRACGYLERVAEEACRSYIRARSTPQIAQYGASWLGRGSNPTPEHLVQLVNRFDSTWATELETTLCADDELLWREIALLVDRRNKMSHGLSEGTGSRMALDLAAHARTVGEWFVVRFDPR